MYTLHDTLHQHDWLLSFKETVEITNWVDNKGEKKVYEWRLGMILKKDKVYSAVLRQFHAKVDKISCKNAQKHEFQCKNLFF